MKSTIQFILILLLTLTIVPAYGEDEVAQEFEEAKKWCQLAAEYGHTGAIFGMTGDGSQNYRGN
jgi:hypothetical protein